MRKLTIGMATYDDYDGLFFTIQSIRMFHREVLDEIEWVIVDNNPFSKHGEAIRNLMRDFKEPFQYLPFTKHQSTTVKNKVFELADTPYVLCIDCHVLLEPGSLRKLIDFYDNHQDDGNLLQGPLLYDDMKTISTHFDLTKWSDHMWGVWGTDERGLDPNGLPFEIPAQGMGLFSCRKKNWLGFNKKFRGFGGEEGYIHQKFKKAGKKTLCLPFLRWNHRFARPNGLPYPNKLEDRFLNYYIGFKELGGNPYIVIENFKKALGEEKIKSLIDQSNQIPDNY